MKIGLFGGSYNPVHNGHIMMADKCRKEFGLERVILMVTSDPPHKQIDGHVDASLRYAMAEKAASKTQCIEASDLEIRRGGVSYTYDTVVELKKLYPEADIYMIVGEDMLIDLPTWYEARKLLAMVNVIAVSRPGVEGDIGNPGEALEQEFGAHVHIARFTGEDISSTAIRSRVRDALPISGMVDPDVERMIYENALYEPPVIASIQQRLKATLKNKRYIHSVGAMQCAIGIAAHFGVDGEKARLAALLHDCAKFEPEKQLELARQKGIEPDAVDVVNPSLLHDRLGAVLAADEYGVDDPEIIQAIASHTLGTESMSPLDEVVYLADKIEPNRTYEDAAVLRGMMNEGIDLDTLTLRCIDMALDVRKRSGKPIKPETARAREALYLKIKTKSV